MNDEIIKDTNRISNCCSAPLYANIDICSDCKEHCGEEEDAGFMTAESIDEMKKIGEIHKAYPNLMHGAGSGCAIEFCPKCLKIDTEND